MDFVFGIVDAVNQVFPAAEVAVFGFHAQIAEQQSIHAFAGEHQRNLVDGSNIFGGDDGFVFHVAEERNLALEFAREKAVGAAEQYVGLDSNAQQLFYRVLRGLGLQFAGGPDPGNQGYMDEDGVVAAHLLPHLADGFQEGQRFNVPNRAANFDDGDVHLLADFLHRRFDFVGDVRDDLHGFTQVVAPALFGDDLLVDASGGEVVVAREPRMGKAFVMAQIEVGLGSIVGHEDLAMLEGRHGAGINVEVRIKLHQVDLESSTLQQAAHRGGRQALAQ